MALDTTQSTLLAKARQRATGMYARAKTVEAKPGGRSLPGSLKNAVGQATDMKIGESEKGNLYVYLYASTVEPVEHHGLSCGQLFALWEDEYRSFDQCLADLCANLKMLGYHEQVESAEDEGEFFGTKLPEIIEDIKERKPYFLFNTSNRARKDGTYNIFIQGLTPEDYTPPVKEGVNEHKDKGYEKKSTVPASPQKTKGPGKKTPASAPVANAPADTKTATKTPGKAAPGKKTPAVKGPPAKKLPFAVGDAVITINDYYDNGETYRGVVKALDAKAETASIAEGDFGDDAQDIPFANLVVRLPLMLLGAPLAPDDGGGSPGFAVGQAVRTTADYFDDGSEYPGVITALNDDTVTVKFDADGSEQDVPLDKVLPA